MIDAPIEAPLPTRRRAPRFAVALAGLAALTALVATVGVMALGGSESDAPVAYGSTDTIDGLTWSIVATRQRRTIQIPGGLAYTSRNGVYLIVELKLENASGRSARAVGEYIGLLGGDGKRYLPDEDGSNAYHLTLGPHRHDPALYDPKRPDPVFGFFDVPEGTARAASVTFDVPRNALGGPVLEVELPDGSRTAFELERR